MNLCELVSDLSNKYIPFNTPTVSQNNYLSKITQYAKKQFTLIELMVVIGIISIMASMLLPAIYKAKKQAHVISEVSRLKQLTTIAIMYSDDYNGAWAGYENINTGLSNLVMKKTGPPSQRGYRNHGLLKDQLKNESNYKLLFGNFHKRTDNGNQKYTESDNLEYFKNASGNAESCWEIRDGIDKLSQLKDKAVFKQVAYESSTGYFVLPFDGDTIIFSRADNSVDNVKLSINYIYKSSTPGRDRDDIWGKIDKK